MALPFTDSQPLLGATGTTITVTDPVSTINGTNVADTSKRQKLSIQFTCANHTAGNGVFKVYVSNDGTNWVQYNRLTDNLTNTSSQNDTRVASVTLSTNTSKIYFFPSGDYFRYVGVSCVVTTDGTYYAQLQAAG